jgi:hypothetical protein
MLLLGDSPDLRTAFTQAVMQIVKQANEFEGSPERHARSRQSCEAERPPSSDTPQGRACGNRSFVLKVLHRFPGRMP